MTEDARQIRELVDSWIAASNARDLPALMDMMTDDVVFMTPGRPPFGKAEFAADSERMKGVAIDARAEVQEIEVFGRSGLRPQPHSGRADLPGPTAEAHVGICDERSCARTPMAAGASPATPIWSCPSKA